MQLLLFDDPNHIELFCPSCLCDSNFFKNEAFSEGKEDFWIAQCEECRFPIQVEFSDNCDPKYYNTTRR